MKPPRSEDSRPSELETARRLTMGITRSARAALTLVPIYLSYFFIWVLWKKLGREPSKERWRAVHTRNARRFYALATEMRGGLIKVGQLISARVDIVPRVWVKELSRLQDRVEPTPFEGIHAHLAEQYGRPPEEVLAHIDPTCLAAASFGQVHRAETHDGRQLALKIRYPDIQAKLAVDMALFGVAVPLFNIFIPKVDLSVIYREMRLALETELDYEQEAAYTRTIHQNFQGFQPTLGGSVRPSGQVVIPEVVDEFSTSSVIATTFFEGYKITDRERMQALGVTATELLELVLNTWTKMMYQDGVFQSDPHPGNLLFNVVEGRTTLCVIDFGQVKILPRDFHQKLVASVMAFITRDVDSYAASIVSVGILSEADAERAKPLLREFFEKYYELSPAEARQLDFDRIREDVQDLLARIEGVHIPTDLVLYGRTFSLLAGLGTALDEHQNLVTLAKPFLMQAILTPRTS
ncbi:MAG: AarF/ABC1/UbiB kinase family protein [Polyangiaceae bacterium]|nr:AarF/ABC1/UbiB kinase family protein [Polyangiaceae bacterium]MCW5791363.1 AarF/ABC1/UbiB kinase family protein [Polyangiaceae bacterium]